MPPCGTSARGRLFRPLFTGQGAAGAAGGPQGELGAAGAASPARGRLNVRPRRARRRLHRRGEAHAHALATSATWQALAGQLLAHRQPARSLSASAGARPPARRLRQVGGHVRQPPQRPDPLRQARQQPLQSSSRLSAAGVQRRRGSLAARIVSPTPPGIVPGSGAFSAAASARSSRADSCPCVADALQNAVVHVADCRDARAPRGRVYADGTGVSSGPRGRLLGGGPARPAQRRRAGQPAW